MLTLSLPRRLLLAAVLVLVTVAALPGSGRSVLAPQGARADIVKMTVPAYSVSSVRNFEANPSTMQLPGGIPLGAIDGKTELFKLFGTNFPAVGVWNGEAWIAPPPVEIIVVWPDHSRYTVGANIKSSSELHFELPASLTKRAYVRLYVATPETEYWFASSSETNQNGQYAQLAVKRSSSDTNCIDTVDAFDALFTLNVLAGKNHANGNCSMDANKDGNFDLSDALHVQREVAGLVRHPYHSSSQQP